MSSVEVYVVVEGQTEQTFVREVLAPQMAAKGIYLYPVLIGKPGHKGGDVRFPRASKDIANLLRQRRDIYVSTMFDYYGIDPHWPGREEVKMRLTSGERLTAGEKAEIIEAMTLERVVADSGGADAGDRFLPYLEMHEFEAMLFSDASLMAEKAELDAAKVGKIVAEFENPEEINEEPEGAPSKRITALNKRYRKIAMGKAIAEAIGVPAIREKCPHFNDWLSKLEGLR